MKLLHIPLFALILIAYNLAAMTGDAETLLKSEFFSVDLISGSHWTLTAGDLFLVFGVIVLYLEIVKSTRTGVASVLDHSLSTLVFVIFLIEFLMVKSCGTSTFFVLMLMALLDVVSGFTVSIVAARRDFNFGGNE
ncbi:MAG: hypothetical protein KJ558_16410 [Gammaproteobacteria bacterium]|nr:hypothetical protein [Gammaproteobacteria bacterium]MBU1656374.1 hypothetical protein [Gammaproteobacteria bacterium]MBU1962130.1 hypothetical protein [Gammaproteobacteria bacterium]